MASPSTSTKTSSKRPNSTEFDCSDAKRRKISLPENEPECSFGIGTFNPLVSLPIELLLKIFKYLKSEDLMDLSLTCTRFYEICTDPLLWKIVKLDDVFLSSQTLKQYMNYVTELTEEIYIKCPSLGPRHSHHKQRVITFEDLYEIKVKCPNLKVLHLENQTLDALEIYCSVFPHTIRELSLKNCHLLNDKYVNRFFGGMDAYFIEMEKLVLTNCLWVTAHSIMVISKLPKLKHLDVSGCLQLHNFMPYLSLSTRYGFKNLEVCNIRVTYINDSEASCFNFCKELKELYFECPEGNINMNEYISMPEESNLVKQEILKSELEQLGTIVPMLQAKLDKVDDKDTRMKILSSNFSLILQDVGKCYTKLNFHRLFLNLIRLQTLVDLERGNINEEIIANLDPSQFKEQIRLQNTPITRIFEQNAEKIVNTKDEEIFAQKYGRFAIFFAHLTKIEDGEKFKHEIHVKRFDKFPMKKLSGELPFARIMLPNFEDEKVVVICEPVTVNVSHHLPSTSGSKTDYVEYIPKIKNTPRAPAPSISDSPLLNREFMQTIRKLTNQSGDFDYEYYEVTDLDIQGIRTGFVNNHVIVAISQNPDGGPPLAVQVPDEEFVPRRRNVRRLELPEVHEGSGICDRTVHALLNKRNESKLERIGFRGYVEITDDCVAPLGVGKHDLKFIDLQNTGVTELGISLLRGYRPTCEIISNYNS